MQKSVITNIIILPLILLSFVTNVSAQLTNAIPTDALIFPSPTITSSRPTITSKPESINVTTFELEGNVLGIQQRNPAVDSDESTANSKLVSNIIAVLLLVVGGVSIYKNKESIKVRIKELQKN